MELAFTLDQLGLLLVAHVNREQLLPSDFVGVLCQYTSTLDTLANGTPVIIFKAEKVND